MRQENSAIHLSGRFNCIVLGRRLPWFDALVQATEHRLRWPDDQDLREKPQHRSGVAAGSDTTMTRGSADGKDVLA